MNFAILFLTTFLSINKAFSAPLMCTMCTVAVASGFGIARMLGVSDLVIGVWFGAILIAISEWSMYFLSKKNITNKLVRFLTFMSSYIFVIFPYIGKNPSVLFNDKKILFIDSFLFSVITGSLVLYFSIKLYAFMKNKNGGHAHFPYEKVVLPIFLLLITSVAFNYFL